MNRDWEADLIKVLAIVAAVPRWVDALMKGDGVPMPASWLGAWTFVSAFMSIGLAAAEVLAANYLFNAWRNQKDRKANWTLLSAAFCLLVFVVILTPNVAAAVRAVKLADVLGDSWLWWLWSGSVAASSFVIAGSVGLAQKRSGTELATSHERASKAETPAEPAGIPCHVPGCGKRFATQSALNAHQKAHAHGNGVHHEQLEPATEQVEHN